MASILHLHCVHCGVMSVAGGAANAKFRHAPITRVPTGGRRKAALVFTLQALQAGFRFL
jgi:hypothetical protein